MTFLQQRKSIKYELKRGLVLRVVETETLEIDTQEWRVVDRESRPLNKTKAEVLAEMGLEKDAFNAKMQGEIDKVSAL